MKLQKGLCLGRNKLICLLLLLKEKLALSWEISNVLIKYESVSDLEGTLHTDLAVLHQAREERSPDLLVLLKSLLSGQCIKCQPRDVLMWLHNRTERRDSVRGHHYHKHYRYNKCCGCTRRDLVRGHHYHKQYCYNYVLWLHNRNRREIG